MTAINGASLIAALVLAWSLYRAHKDQNGLSRFNLFDLLMANGRVSRLAFAFMGAFLVTSWIMVQLTIAGKMSEGYVTLYGATWVAPIIARLFNGSANAPPPEQKP